jgi:hypothetical protein
MDWNDVAQHREQWRALVITARKLRALQNFGNLLSDCPTGGFS